MAGSVSGIGEDLQSRFLTGQQRDAGGSVAGVRRRERGGGDQTGFGFDGDVGL